MLGFVFSLLALEKLAGAASEEHSDGWRGGATCQWSMGATPISVVVKGAGALVARAVST